ncbi:hypothetical protein KIW84_035151 [Lathyrus oleraceus]|uniref:Uncharacterized protein n=1 Tax=Pisum sativum TaxID=3888 RepID=A0A9D4Y0N2_PEA|nr:hypothetical protein KIW84_035151 [Pisum sativum]
MPGLDSEILEHRFPLKPECPPVKQKLRRTHPDMAVKIKEEVEKGIEVDPAKVKAIQEMPAPKTKKQVREYDIEYRSQKTIKGSILADHLAHQPIENQLVQYDFADEEILYLKMKDCDEPLLEEGPEPGSC